LWPGEAKFREVADDQSIITGYACSTPGTHHLPVEHALVRHLAFGLYRLGRAAKNLRLGPDGKLIVFVRESDDGNSWMLERVSVSAQHAADWNAVDVRRAIHKRVLSDAKNFAGLVPGLSVSSSLDLLVNEAGDFVEGGPHGDNGLSGKKLVVDFYGPRVPIGGGAMSGKDFWKVDRAGPLIARDLAVAAVQRLGCKACTVTLAIFPGDREFRIASAQSHGATHKVVVHNDTQQSGAHSPTATTTSHTQTISNIDPAKLAGLVDLRLCSKINWPSEADNLIDVARWGHFVPMNAWNITRNNATVAACTV
jgi:S-adenosylmethionine synthetase